MQIKKWTKEIFYIWDYLIIRLTEIIQVLVMKSFVKVKIAYIALVKIINAHILSCKVKIQLMKKIYICLQRKENAVNELYLEMGLKINENGGQNSEK